MLPKAIALGETKINVRRALVKGLIPMRRIAGLSMAIVFAILLGGLFALFHTDETHAVTTVPTKMNFQGRLTDSAGNVKPDGLYNMKFRLFTVSSGGSDVWNETRETTNRVQVTNGLFSVKLGDVTPVPASLFASGSLYLEIELPTPATATCSTASCASFTEGAMTPRNQLSTSAYAYNAETLDGLDSAAFAQLSADNTFSGINVFKRTDSARPLEVQNAAGAELLSVDPSRAGRVTLLGNNEGESYAWQSSTALPAGLSDFVSVTANGYVYAIGGGTGVYYAKLNANGTVGTWTTSGNTLPLARFGATAVTANGYVYVMGGTGPDTTVYYAKLNAVDGSIGAWQTSSNSLLNGGVGDATSVYANGYIYVMGGNNSGVKQAIYYTKVNADGSIGAWSTEATNILPTNGRYRATSVYANGYVYVIGGPSGGADVSYAKLNANGSVGTWTNMASNLPAVREDATSVVSNGYVYVMGGSANSGTTGNNTVYYAPLNADGSLGSWTTSALTLPAARCRSASVIANGYAYVLGGNAGGATDCGNTTSQTTVYYARVSGVVRIGGNLDLVGLQGETLSDGGSSSTGSTGGSITAGNITGVGSLQIQGLANFADSVSVAGNVIAAGLSIQDASGIKMLFTDSTNSRIYLGNPTGDTTGVLLVLDTKTSSGDPTGVNGGMYYNSNSGKFRCYENSAWKNCLNSTLDTISTFNSGLPDLGNSPDTTDEEIGKPAGSVSSTIIIVPLYIPGQITVNDIRLRATATLGGTGDVGLYDANGTRVINGGSGSLTIAAPGLKVITPAQSAGAARTLESGQYYAAITWNGTTGTVNGEALPVNGLIKRLGVITGGGSVLPSSIDLNSITASNVIPFLTFNN